MNTIAAIESLVAQVSDRPVAMARLALVLIEKGEVERAQALCTRALALAPGNGEVHSIATDVFSHKVPQWYFPMVLDAARHQLYERAFRKAMRPGCRVLEIGAGTGLFAMMAARAGAGEVVTCEANPHVAAAVAAIVERNGLSDRVRVIAKNSSDLEIGIDMDGPADVVVWDNLANNLVGANALPSLEQAARRLAKPGARFIPARGAIRVCLAQDRKPEFHEMGMVEGFDLSPFNQRRRRHYSLTVDDARWAARSAAADIFRFDFESGGPFPEARSSVTLTSSGGCVTGVMQWMRLELDDETHYENAPPTSDTAALGPLFHSFAAPISLPAGQTIEVHGAHDRIGLRLWADFVPVR